MLFDNIKYHLFKRKLQAAIKNLSRNVIIKNEEEVKTIGILYNVPEEEIAYREFTEFISKFQSRRKEIKALGFYNTSKIPHYCYAKISYDYFNHKNINWYGVPSGEKVEDFIKINFDLIINLDNCEKNFFKYIVAASRANLKIGPISSQTTQPYDIMLDRPEDQDNKIYIENIFNYLNILKK